MAREMTWDCNGRWVTAGAASCRCYDDLVDQRGPAEAERLRDAADLSMARVRSLFRGARGQDKLDVTLEGFLLAVGVPIDKIPALARRYRSSATASVDLSGYLKD
jgi:hypothetical protein